MAKNKKKLVKALDKIQESVERLKNCGAGAPGSPGFQPGNSCAGGGGGGNAGGRYSSDKSTWENATQENKVISGLIDSEKELTKEQTQYVKDALSEFELQLTDGDESSLAEAYEDAMQSIGFSWGGDDDDDEGSSASLSKFRKSRKEIVGNLKKKAPVPAPHRPLAKAALEEFRLQLEDDDSSMWEAYPKTLEYLGYDDSWNDD